MGEGRTETAEEPRAVPAAAGVANADARKVGEDAESVATEVALKPNGWNRGKL